MLLILFAVATSLRGLLQSIIDRVITTMGGLPREVEGGPFLLVNKEVRVASWSRETREASLFGRLFLDRRISGGNKKGGGEIGNQGDSQVKRLSYIK